MKALADYFRELSDWEGMPAARLTGRWHRSESNEIIERFTTAFVRRDFPSQKFRVSSKATNQAIGNKIARLFACEINPCLRGFSVQPCPGQGYPDRRLVRVTDNRAFALELKATSSFDETHTNRIILTCSSAKLRRFFQSPIKHLLATVCYRRQGRHLWIEDLRLDFLQPWTPVRVRLEAAVTQRQLARGKHANCHNVRGS